MSFASAQILRWPVFPYWGWKAGLSKDVPWELDKRVSQRMAMVAFSIASSIPAIAILGLIFIYS